MSKAFDDQLEKVYQGHSGIGQELTFIQTVFGFLRRRKGFFSNDAQARKVLKMAKMHVERSKLDSKKTKKAKTEPAPKPVEEAKTEPKQTEDNNEPQPTVSTDGRKEAWVQPKKEDEKEEDEDDDDDDKDRPLGNGGRTERYLWTQTLKELTVHVWLPEGVQRSRDLSVTMNRKGIKVQMKADKKDIIAGEWQEPIITDDTTWVIDENEGKKSLTLYIQKQNQMTWWKAVLKGDPEIDTKKVKPEESKISDLTGETRGMVEKMMFDQNQKRMGKPTSDEMRKKDMLKKFMAQHPEMDFSKAKVM
mmetsp:Transcript_8249/g.12876  ORF Transcript_8249/g.12876 Transcript_8249/m.12876 type:complete len:304 (-) Transcript_8249:195-1106(-)